MNPGGDRIPVPTNGSGRHLLDDGSTAPATPADTPVPDAPSVTVTPAQLAIGFGVIASVILFLVGRMRRRSRSGRGPFGRR
jgi:hypothetical protein